MSRQSSLLAAILAALLITSCASGPAGAGRQAGGQPESAAKERAAALVQGGSQGQAAPAPSPAAEAAAAKPEEPPQVEEALPPPPATLSAEEAAFLQSYLARLNYMVYYAESSTLDPRLAKVAVSSANRYLIEKEGLSVIDFDRVESNKRDQATAWQAETGGSVGIIQYLAQKFNADVYVELDFTVSSEVRDSKYYASAQGTMKLYETSTASLLGSLVFASQPAFSPSSLEAALNNAVAASVWTAMPKMVAQSRDLLRASLQRGIRYELVLQNTQDGKAVSLFRRALAARVRELEQTSYSAEETRFSLYSFQARDKVEDAIYAAASASGLRDLYPVLMRGSSFTFNTGK
jgi:hypothetical protein